MEGPGAVDPCVVDACATDTDHAGAGAGAASSCRLSYIGLRALPLPKNASVPQAGLTPPMESAPMKNDIQIQQEVSAEIDHDDKVPTGSVGVEVHHGVVKLAGAPSDAKTKEIVERDARRIDGVTNVLVDMDAGQRR